MLRAGGSSLVSLTMFKFGLGYERFIQRGTGIKWTTTELKLLIQVGYWTGLLLTCKERILKQSIKIQKSSNDIPSFNQIALPTSESVHTERSTVTLSMGWELSKMSCL